MFTKVFYMVPVEKSKLLFSMYSLNFQIFIFSLPLVNNWTPAHMVTQERCNAILEKTDTHFSLASERQTDRKSRGVSKCC